MKNKNIVIAITGLAIIAILALVFINRSATPETTIQSETQQEPLSSEENEEGTATLEFSIDNPEEDKAEESSSSVNNETTETEQVLGEEEQKQEVYTFFYGETCPYCHDVITWFEETGVESELNIVRKEVYNNVTNSQQMSLAAQVCGESSGGVPFLFTPDKECVIGSTPIIDYLSEVAGI